MGKIVFLVQHLGQPRCVKRIISVKESGFDVEVHGFDRGNYSENIRLFEDNGVSLKTVIRTKGLSKIAKLVAYAKLVRSVARSIEKDDVIYAFGFELASFTRLLTRAKYIYECADVVAAREHSRWMKLLDKRNINKSCFSVLTSEGFADFFWGDKREDPVIREKYLLQPNRLSPFFLTQSRPDAKYVSSAKIRFGFVGLFRFLEIYLTFCEMIGKDYPNFEFHFWGDSDEADKEKLKEMDRKYPGVFFHGAFTNPKDLASVYDTFDVCVTCYNTDSGNVKIAEPNKLYESIYFCKPIIVSKGTFLGKKVEQLKVGLAIEPSNDGIKAFLNTITPERLNEMIEAESKMDKKELIDNSEQLCSRIASIMSM